MPVGTTQGLITRCPDCSTAFRASAEQLSARDGHVRCGRCGRVFDAVENAVPVLQAKPVIEHVLDELDADTGASPAESLSPASDFVAGQTAPAESLPESVAMPAADEPEQAVAAVDVVVDNELQVRVAAPEEGGVSMEAASDVSGATPPVDIAAAETSTVAVFAASKPSVASTTAPLLAEDAVTDSAHVRTSGMSNTTPIVEPLEWEFGRPKPTTRSVPRWAGIPGVLVLSVVLLGQVAHHLRSDLVLLFPSIRPAAEQICEWAGCDLPSPQRAELMSIESSDLQADSTNPAVMVLSATLRNRAPFPQAPPALELTLTDAQDQPTARRVLNADDYSLRGVQNNLFPASSELPIKVYFEASAVKATGYRLYLFYP